MRVDIYIQRITHGREFLIQLSPRVQLEIYIHAHKVQHTAVFATLFDVFAACVRNNINICCILASSDGECAFLLEFNKSYLLSGINFVGFVRKRATRFTMTNFYCKFSL